MTREELELELGEPITQDGLSATFQIFQRKHGHRHSIDDLLTAWFALEHAQPDRSLDLGTGIGTVGLLLCSALPALRLTCIEAQDISYRLLRANIALNGVGERVRALHGDLRALADDRYPLVTGSPPYFPPGTGVLPSDSQKAHARFELRGDVGDYAKAAREHLEPDGLFVFCFPTPQ
ncbi:MAG TPA: methyltransferase, partial [Kofleriaceae bacterium]